MREQAPPFIYRGSIVCADLRTAEAAQIPHAAAGQRPEDALF